MDGMVFAAGLGALGFWLFIAAVSCAGVWDGVRKRDAQHETLRRLAESGQQVDQVLVDTLFGSNKQIWRDLRIGGLVCVGVAPGLAILGSLIGIQEPDVILPLFGVAGLVFCIAMGLFAAAKFARESDQRDPRV